MNHPNPTVRTGAGTSSTDAFDPSSEPENPFNPIAGQSVLVWLREHALEGYESSEPDCEDWGWYIEVQGGDSVYTVGAICFDDEGDGGQRGQGRCVTRVDDPGREAADGG